MSEVTINGKEFEVMPFEMEVKGQSVDFSIECEFPIELRVGEFAVIGWGDDGSAQDLEAKVVSVDREPLKTVITFQGWPK